MRVVLDTSVLASAFRSALGASYRLLWLALDGKIRLLSTPALFLEYEDVLTRPEQMDVHGFSREEIAMFLEDLAALVEPVQVFFQWRPQLRDADDEIVLEAAVNGRAKCIVTHNVRDFEGVGRSFGVRIVQPGKLLKEVKV